MIIPVFCIAVFQFNCDTPQIPTPVIKLMLSYPDVVTGYADNYVEFYDGTSLIYDDGKNKTMQELLDNPDIEDQFRYSYHKGTVDQSKLSDAGRIRNEEFFKTLYGATSESVEENLVEIIWCPKLVNQVIRVTKINGVDEALQRISDELDNHPEIKDYVTNIGGTYNWRYINGTNRLSNHSFGMTIDINTKYANYWQWSCSCTNEDSNVPYQNKVSQIIVDIFEKHGFIWGGKWLHFDTMHFEYRPELLISL